MVTDPYRLLEDEVRESIEVADEWALLADNLELELPESYGARE